MDGSILATKTCSPLCGFLDCNYTMLNHIFHLWLSKLSSITELQCPWSGHNLFGTFRPSALAGRCHFLFIILISIELSYMAGCMPCFLVIKEYRLYTQMVPSVCLIIVLNLYFMGLILNNYNQVQFLLSLTAKL